MRGGDKTENKKKNQNSVFLIKTRKRMENLLLYKSLESKKYTFAYNLNTDTESYINKYL